MFGANELALNESRLSGQSLRVKEIFATIQGEGPLAGMPAIFIRLAGCNLACHYCDTDFSGGVPMSLPAILDACEEAAVNGRYPLVVITGGEPMRQNIAPLCKALPAYFSHVQIETAGTVFPPDLLIGGALSIVCSPKTKRIHPMVAAFCRDFKYIVGAGDHDDGDGLPIMSTQRDGEMQRIYRPEHPDARIWVQPRMDYIAGTLTPAEEKNAENAAIAANIAREFGYRLSIQQHKILNLP